MQIDASSMEVQIAKTGNSVRNGKDASMYANIPNTGSAQLAEGKTGKGKMLKRYRIRDYDFKLILLLIAVTVIGILSIGSAKPEVQNKQILGFVMGLFIMIVLSFF